ncbi:DEAD/DEAH box helicase [SAR202 cluster bacterium AD-804-J14_MRT_500m]|nr:DEAD/DEAH box helicase [SAR202 cluster bacterium AD-804-J14_MRT_500m]
MVEHYELAKEANSVDSDTLKAVLVDAGFTRKLTEPQLRNVCKMALMPAAATFSVPGAGKTTEALAFFFFKAKDEDRLLVIAPKNAFAAWDEEKTECVPKAPESFTRLRGGRARIKELLDKNPRFMLITYQQLIQDNVNDLISAYCDENRAFVFLDESHRIKTGTGIQSRTVLGLAHLPVGKLILSGTPMPQAVADLEPQFKFLYPEVSTISKNMVQLFRPVFVRTNKKELNLPDITTKVIEVPMDPLQREVYNLMSSETLRQARLAKNTRTEFRALGRSVMRLLQFASNPALLSSQMEDAHSERLGAVLAQGDGPKIRAVLNRIRQFAPEQKIIVWTSFVKNVEYLAFRLAHLGAVYIHGGVDSGDEEDDESREGKIKLFHDNPNVRVLVANPAAAGEGVSLHKICHYAIYLDRTFNAAHYMQSQDRIHRVGLKPDQKTLIEVFQCKSSVDDTVRQRLSTKMKAMKQALDDPSIQIDPFPIDLSNSEDVEDTTGVIDQSDVDQLINDLQSSEA